MKKILILGGAKAQVPLIKAAKQEGYYVVLCDWTTTNPGIPLADKHYQVSTLDLQAVMEVAKHENIDGVISNSEPAMENVAVISSELGLVGNSVGSIEQLQSKCKFRKLQKSVNAFAPDAFESGNADTFLQKIAELTFPVVVKPSKSSGSRGTAFFDHFDRQGIQRAFEACAAFSVNDLVTGEEYIPMPSLINVDADIFVHHGKILWNGLFSCVRSNALPLVPHMEMFPSILNQDQRSLLERKITEILNAADFRFGEVNVEGYFTECGELFVIEINARQGGNNIPELICDHSGIDMYKLLISTCCGDDTYFNDIMDVRHQENCITNFVVFPARSGVLKGIYIDPELANYVYKITQNIPSGKAIRKAEDATDAVAMLRLRFPDQKTQLEWLPKLDDLIYAEVEA